MKYLKKYRLFESSTPVDGIIQDISDICIELVDCEIDYIINKNMKYYADNIKGYDCVSISLKDISERFFRISDIEDVLLRLKSYLKDTDWKIDCGFPADDTYLPLKYFLTEYSGEEIYEMTIYIYRDTQIIKESLSSNDLVLDVKDIFLDLRDDGYELDVDMRPQGVDMFSVGIANDNLFDWTNVKEEFLRTKQLVNENGFELKKMIVTYYPQGSFNGSVRVLSRMRTEKIVASAWSYFIYFMNEKLIEDNCKLYEVAFIFEPK